MSEVTLTKDSHAILLKRAAIGEAIMRLAWGHKLVDEDRESAATDAISDVLTALFGAAGHWKMGRGLRPREFALNEARRIVEHAFDSWQGDAEDYIIEPELGEYGYEGDD